MTTVLLIIHLFVTLALIGVVLIQRSEGGGLGIGSSQGMGAFMILATAFMGLSLTLALMNRGTTGVGGSLLEAPSQGSTPTPGRVLPAGPPPTSQAPAPAPPAAPKGPAVPTN
jgi:preprotein translocase subunit SecG